MSHRERVLAAIEFESPDHIPTIHAALRGGYLRHGERLVELFRRYPDDFSPQPALPEIDEPPLDTPDYYREEEDEWGCVWEYRIPGLVGIVKCRPLSDWEGLEDYRFPEPPSDSDEAFEQEKERIAQRPQEYPALGGGGNFFERLQWLRGYESLMLDLIEGRAELTLLADRLLEYNLKLIRRSLRMGVDIVSFADDWGSQQQLMISPKVWREFFKPRYAAE